MYSEQEKGEIMRNEREVVEKAREAARLAEMPRWAAMTYEEGLRDALEWVLGGDDPLGDD